MTLAIPKCSEICVLSVEEGTGRFYSREGLRGSGLARRGFDRFWTSRQFRGTLRGRNTFTYKPRASFA